MAEINITQLEADLLIAMEKITIDDEEFFEILLNVYNFVIPAYAGIQPTPVNTYTCLDSRLRGNDNSAKYE